MKDWSQSIDLGEWIEALSSCAMRAIVLLSAWLELWKSDRGKFMEELQKIQTEAKDGEVWL